MKNQTTRELFQHDMQKLREIATQQATLYVFIEQNKDLFLTTDGRVKRSRAYKAAQRFRAKHKAMRYHNAARRIYSAWKYLGINCVKAGKMYQSILDAKLETLKTQNLNLRITGEELEWDSMVLYTPKSHYYKNIKQDNFMASLSGVSIEAA
jgi:hypothetical protein